MTTSAAPWHAATGTAPPEWLGALLSGSPPGDAAAVLDFSMPADPAVVGEARSFVRTTFTGWDCDDAVFDAQLVVSELVTNAIRHGGGARSLRLVYSRRRLGCAVRDFSGAVPVTATSGFLAEFGRGLPLIEALTTAWGWLYPVGGGKLVWAALT
ncbi:ATP-binding protein [Nonomuraea sp. NPDC049152]|uniref:ATP-binding protein n=1 Tax=Nonomuraea sp. NPDC049152 TaxID=3154350 RepID=UPI0033DB34C0